MAELLLFVAVLSLDAFTASAAYGTEKIKIGLLPAVMISTVGGLALFLSSMFSTFLAGFITESFCRVFGFIALFLVGAFNFIQGALKSAVRRKREGSAKMRFRLRELDFFVEVFIDETKADADHSNALSAKEAFYLAAALSVDSLVTGIGCGFSGMNPFALGAAAFIVNFAAILLGWLVGKGISRCARLDLSWLGGAVLIGLALFRFLAG
ncbi:MAG: sporulation membrane protein YtaF [Oscillospiraceae bacterium]|nr:sporulation membrane protein YtaF [Oscillospiraceae bacterium]